MIVIIVAVYRGARVENNEYQELAGRSVIWQGKIVSEPAFSSFGNQVLIILPDGHTQFVRVSLFNHAYAEKGDRVLLSGEVSMPRNFSDFDYVNFLSKDNVYAEIKKAQVLVIEPSRGLFWRVLRAVKEYALTKLDKNLAKDKSAVISGILLGQKDATQKGLQEDFKITGLSHILIASGYNLTIVAGMAGFLAWIVGRRFADILGLVWVWLFVLLVGTGSSVVRAGVMASIFLLARIFGRLSFSKLSLFLAVAILSAINPKMLLYDVGFQLSITATWGVIEAGRLASWQGWDGFWGRLLAPTAGAIIFTLPIISYYFGTLSLISPISNILVVPFVPLLMLLGSLCLIPIIGQYIFPLLDLGLGGLLWLINALASWPQSQINFKVDGWFVGCYYLVLCIGVMLFKEAKKRRLKEQYRHANITKVIL